MGDAHLTDEALNEILGCDFTAVDPIAEAAVGIAVRTTRYTHRLFVPPVGDPERLEQVVLVPKPRIDAGFDLARIGHCDGMPLVGQDGQAELATTH